MTTSQQPPPGWYDDPAGTGRQRWWDGSDWTEHYQAPANRGWSPGAGVPRPPDRTWVVFAHGSAFLGAWLAVAFVGPLVVYLLRRDDPVVRPHAVAALNFQLSWLLYGVLAVIAIGVLLAVSDIYDIALVVGVPTLVGGLVWAVITLSATIRAGRGADDVRYPLAIRFIPLARRRRPEYCSGRRESKTLEWGSVMDASLASATPDAGAERSRALALLGVCGAAFLVFLDTTIVNVAFPDLSADFAGADAHELVWVLDGYFIAVAALLVPAGGIGDHLGRKRLLVAGLAGFALTSLICAVAPSWQVLTAARVVQGIAGAMIVPASMALLLSLYPAERRATGVGIWGAAAALAAAVGPVLGGALVEVAGWRWIFLVNLPLGAIVIWAAMRGLQESRDEHSQGVPELVGSVLVAMALGLLALALVRGNDWGWTSATTLAAFGGAVVASAGAVLRSAHHPRPAVDLTLMRIPSFRLGTLGTTLFAMGFFSMILGNILFLTEVWQYSVLHAGLAVAPGPVASTLVAGFAGRIADRFGHRAVIIPGTLAYAAGILVLRLVPGQGGDYLADWLPGQLLSGVGIGLAFPALGAAAVQDVPERQFGSASAMNAAARQVGAVIGTAILVAFVATATDYPSAMRAFDDSYLVAAASALLSGLVMLPLRPAAHHREAAAAGQRPVPESLAEPAGSIR